MEIITSEMIPVRLLAERAIQDCLYHSTAWTIISCYRNVLADPEVEESTTMLLMQDDNKNSVGAVYFNDVFTEYAWDTNIQMFIKEEYRGRGYAKDLFIALTNLLKKSGWEGMFDSGYGIPGSASFWSRMSDLHEKEPEKYYQLHMSY